MVQWNVAAMHLSLLTELHPESWWFWRARGCVRMKTGHPDQAEEDFDKAIHARPDDGWSWLGRGLARKRQNKSEPALDDLARSVEIEPTAAIGWGARGEILGIKGRWDEAARHLAQWSALGGESSPIPWYFHTLLRAYTNDQPGYRQACATMWEHFNKTTDPFVAALLAHACSLEPDCGVTAEDIVALAEQAVRAKLDDGWTLFTLGAALRRAGRYEEAITKFDEAAKVSPRGTYVPLVEALRELTIRSFPARSANDPAAQSHIKKTASPDRNSMWLASRMKTIKAPWQYQVEAILLGRELDAN